MDFNETAKLFGAKLKYFRTLNNFTQEDLSAMIGVDVRYLSDIERGKRNITLKTLCKLADALKVELSTLFNPF